MDSYQLRYALVTSVPFFTAVCAKDQLHEINKEEFAIICNNQNSSEAGMHWVCFYKDKNTNILEFFDSFGMPLIFYGNEFVQFAKKFGGNIHLNKNQLQSNSSHFCGNYCLYFLIKRSRCTDFDKALAVFSPNKLTSNDKFVDDFVNQHFQFPSFSDCEKLCQLKCAEKGIDLTSVCVQQNKQCVRVGKNLKLCRE